MIVSNKIIIFQVRLLTGVGRFNEMTYIFDSLKQNDEFELLLKKGIEKENSLKIALLDYLKRFHPTDIETYDMVAHNFLMYREIAKMLETQAQKQLAMFKNQKVVGKSWLIIINNRHQLGMLTFCKILCTRICIFFSIFFPIFIYRICILKSLRNGFFF